MRSTRALPWIDIGSLVSPAVEQMIGLIAQSFVGALFAVAIAREGVSIEQIAAVFD